MVRKNEHPKKKWHARESALDKSEKIYSEETKIDDLEKEVENKEKRILRHEKKIAATEKELLANEEEIRQEAARIFHKVHEKPLRKVTRADVNKGVIGSFFGLVSHFAFLTSGLVINDISLIRAVLILVMSYLVGYVMIEKTGYRVVREQRYFNFIPARVTVIYITALLSSLFVLVLYKQIADYHIEYLIKTIAVTSLLAIPGAAGAHMLGHN